MPTSNMVQFAVEIYTHIVSVAFPCAVVFGLGNFMAETLLRVAFGGKLRLGGGRGD